MNATSPRLVRKRISSLRHAPENSEIYDRFDLDNADDLALYQDVDRVGIQQPLNICQDGVVFDGNRRLAVLRRREQSFVKCFVHDFAWNDLSHEEKLKLLRNNNLQREKSVAEQIRESIIEVDHSVAVDNLRLRRDRSENGYLVDGIAPLQIERRSNRHGISAEKSEHVKYLKEVVFALKKYWPISVRTAHYKLLNFDFLRNTRLGLKYANDDGSYDTTGDLKNRLCLLGELPWAAFADPTRPFKQYHAFQNARQFVKQECRNLFCGYWRDYLQSQPHYVEVFCEKNTVYHFAESVTKKYLLRQSSGRGFNAVQCFYEMHQRYLRSKKKKLILITLSDYDPEGQRLVHSAGQVLMSDFGVPAHDLEIIPAGVTREQIERYELPSMLFAKENSTNHDWFVERNGGDDSVYELESLDPADLLRDLEAVITSVLDMELFRAEEAAEEEEADYLEACTERAIEALEGIAD